jgi:hypothetical protein
VTQQPWRIILLFVALEMVGVGGVGAWAAQRFGFDYASLSPVAYLIAGAAGFFARRAGGSGLLAGATVGLLDASAWALFGGIGPQPTAPEFGAAAKAAAVAMVTLSNGAAGALGGWLGGRSRPVAA